jgi:DnaK suppressor protein
MYKKMLADKRVELVAGLGSRDEIAIERSADQADEIQGALDREMVIRSLDSKALILRSVAAAMRRLDAGTFGVCIQCEEEINPKRLAAVPWTPLCITCQEAADHQHSDALEFSGFKAA